MVGIFLTTFNMLELTKRCLASFQRHTTYPHKLVVVDNHSEDGTVEYLREAGYEVIANPGPISLTKAINQGLDRFMGDPDVEYIGWIENDMIFLPFWLDNLVAILRENPEIGKIGSTSIDGDVPNDEEVVSRITREGSWLRLGNAVPWIMPKWAIAEVGPYDEGFIYGGGYDDWDYNNRLLERGIPVMVTRRSLVWNHGGTSKVLQPPNAEEHNMQYYCKKWGHFHWGWCHPYPATDKSLW